MNDSHMFDAARATSLNANYTGGNGVKLGCVIAYKGSILAKGCNSDKTHPMQEHYNQYRFKNTGHKYLPAKCHAEMRALAKIKYLDIDFSDAQIYVYRELKNGKRAMARPCPACMNALKNKGIVKIYYTTDAGYAYERLV